MINLPGQQKEKFSKKDSFSTDYLAYNLVIPPLL